MQIALLTDFGTHDPYVAAMKGVIASRTTAAIHDLSHDIPPHDVFAAAWFLGSVEPYWPEATIFVCVVDPGVGTQRKIVAMKKSGRYFLAPDNGLLTFIDMRETTDGRASETHAVTNESFFLPDGSTTFHGRDRFAPVAAAIAGGAPLSEVGPPIRSILRLEYDPPDYKPDGVKGTIVTIDRFGNAVTDIEARRIPFGRFFLHAGGVAISHLAPNYENGGPGPFAIVGSTGCLEISLRRGSAAAELQLRVLDHVELRPQPV